MSKRQSQPKLWAASVKALSIKDGNWYIATITSSYAHITKRAGNNDLFRVLYDAFDPREYSQQQIIGDVVGISLRYIKRAFEDFIDFGDDDDSDRDDTPEVEPSPEDHGVELKDFVPAMAELISGLNIDD